MSFMQDYVQQVALQRLSENSGEKSFTRTITADLSTGTLKTASEALIEVTNPYFERLTELRKEPQSAERDAQIQRQANLQKILEDAWSTRINFLAKQQ